MKLKKLITVLALSAMTAPAAFAATETLTLDFKGQRLTGLNQLQLREELQAQYPELNVENLSLVGLEVTAKVDGVHHERLPVALASDGVTDPFLMTVDGDVELQTIAMNVEPMKSGTVIIRRGPGYDDGWGHRRYRDRPGYRYHRPGVRVIVPGYDGRRDRPGYRRDRECRASASWCRRHGYRPRWGSIEQPAQNVDYAQATSPVAYKTEQQ